MPASASPVSLHPVRVLGPCPPSLSTLPLPLEGMRATCGFPSPAEDHQAETLDLNQRCIRHPAATFFVEADSGDSMVGHGIYPRDTLVVDRALTPQHGDIVIAVWEGGLVVKRLQLRPRPTLVSDHPPLVPGEGEELVIWGVVAWSFRSHRSGR